MNKRSISLGGIIVIGFVALTISIVSVARAGWWAPRAKESPEVPILPVKLPLEPVISSRELEIELHRVLEEEPTIQEVQQAAIAYAEVDSQKIQRWRKLASRRAWFPKVTIDIDQDLDRTIGSSSKSGSTFFTVGPEDRSLSFDLGLTWDLKDLIWDPDQTAIDVRSRLMVYLRGDLLDEVTELYFDRRRVQLQRMPSESPDLKRERKLRIEELTARIDALTDGFLSARLNKDLEP